ncbi:hypothetical protein FHS19_005203 [Paenibacillus rhizosphaerae]|uniref:Uncharacterized protein n=1 Tax=Paenibacillus rhizosphaerae TaxID=297318 RepID=A0A839TTR6_9BACL|nr:hypothetical protein [Paenibacillus rhizosphaerae]
MTLLSLPLAYKVIVFFESLTRSKQVPGQVLQVLIRPDMATIELTETMNVNIEKKR